MASMELEQIFSIATQRELEANAFYRRVASAAHDQATRAIFEQLADDEMGHFELLEKFRHDPTLQMRMEAPAPDYGLAEATELPSFSDDMTPRDAIALAMKKEQQAAEFYRRLAGAAKDSGLRDILNNLANMELGHKQRLENAFVDVGYPETF